MMIMMTGKRRLIRVLSISCLCIRELGVIRNLGFRSLLLLVRVQRERIRLIRLVLPVGVVINVIVKERWSRIPLLNRIFPIVIMRSLILVLIVLSKSKLVVKTKNP